MVNYYDLKAGMVVSVEKVDMNRWQNMLGDDLIINPALTPQIWYNRYYKKFIGVPIKIVGKEKTTRPHHSNNRNPYEVLNVKTIKGEEGYLPEFLFNPRDNDAFKIRLDRGRDVRNTRLMAARMGLPHGPESIIASQLSGLPGNAAEQNDQLAKEDGMISGPAPDRRGFSGGKTRKGRKSKKTRRTRKH